MVKSIGYAGVWFGIFSWYHIVLYSTLALCAPAGHVDGSCQTELAGRGIVSKSGRYTTNKLLHGR